MTRKTSKVMITGLIILGLALIFYFAGRRDHDRLTRHKEDTFPTGSTTRPAAPEESPRVSGGVTITPIATRKQISAVRASFLEAKSCALAARAKTRMAAELKVCEENSQLANDPDSKEFFESCRKKSSDFPAAIEAATRDLAHCDRDTGMLEDRFYRDTVAAAAAGDADAQICYIATRFQLGRPWTEEEKAAYKVSASRYVEDAFTRGDWRIVELLRTSSLNMVNRYTLMHLAVPFDSTNAYRMNRLQRLGTTDAKFARYLDALAKNGPQPSPQEKADADAWAQRMYQGTFKRSPSQTKAPNTCADQLGPYSSDS